MVMDDDSASPAGRARTSWLAVAGEDIFRFISGDSDVDVVEDYEDGLDRLNVKDWDVSFNQLSFTQVNGDVLVSGDDAGESFILDDTDENEIKSRRLHRLVLGQVPRLGEGNLPNFFRAALRSRPPPSSPWWGKDCRLAFGAVKVRSICRAWGAALTCSAASKAA